MVNQEQKQEVETFMQANGIERFSSDVDAPCYVRFEKKYGYGFSLFIHADEQYILPEDFLTQVQVIVKTEGK